MWFRKWFSSYSESYPNKRYGGGIVYTCNIFLLIENKIIVLILFLCVFLFISFLFLCFCLWFGKVGDVSLVERWGWVFCISCILHILQAFLWLSLIMFALVPHLAVGLLIPSYSLCLFLCLRWAFPLLIGYSQSMPLAIVRMSVLIAMQIVVCCIGISVCLHSQLCTIDQTIFFFGCGFLPLLEVFQVRLKHCCQCEVGSVLCLCLDTLVSCRLYFVSMDSWV